MWHTENLSVEIQDQFLNTFIMQAAWLHLVMKLLCVCIKGMSSTVGAVLSITFVLKAVLCTVRNKATEKKLVFLELYFIESNN